VMLMRISCFFTGVRPGLYTSLYLRSSFMDAVALLSSSQALSLWHPVMIECGELVFLNPLRARWQIILPRFLLHPWMH